MFVQLIGIWKVRGKRFRLNFLKAKKLIDGNLGWLQFGMCCMHQDPSYSGSIAPQDQMKGARKCDGTVQGSSDQHCYLSMLKNSTSSFGGEKIVQVLFDLIHVIS